MAVQINVQASQAALIQSINQGVTAFNTRYAGQNQLNLQINARSFSQPLGRITSDLADFESALKASNARVLAFGASTAVLGGVVKTFKEIATTTIEVEKSLTDINRVLNLSTSGLQKFSSELFTISKQTATSFQDASKAALEFSRQGLTTQETLKRTADALTLVRLTGMSSSKAVEDLTATVNGFSKAGLTTSQVVNKLAAVEQDFAVSATDLTEALSRTGQAAQEAGVEFDQLNALVTSAQESTARGGAVIGNALKTIFTRLQRTETLDQLENFNIAVRDIQGNILPAVQILQNFAKSYNSLADAQRAQLSEQVAGVYQVNILKAVINDMNNAQGTFNKSLERGARASNEAEIANARLNQTLSALTTQTGIGLQQLANNVGKVTFEPIFKSLVSPVNDAVEYINETLEGDGIGSVFANGLLKGIRNVITGPGLALAFAVIAKVAKNTFEDATKALPAILGITTEAQKRANIEKSILTILQGQGQISQALIGQQGNSAAQAQLLLNLAKAQTAQYQQQLAIAQQLAGTLATQGVTVGTRGLQVGPKIKAGGHIPSHAAAGEKLGAMAGGYKPGKVIKAPSSVGNAIMNSAEEVRYFAGFSQPFINPPANSKAGRAHRQKAISRTGVDPYMYGGFIPNFAEILDVAARPYDVKDGDTVTADATIKRIRDFRLEKVDAVESNQRWGLAAKGLALKYYPTAEKFAPAINATGKAAYDRLSFISNELSEGLISKGYGVPDLRYVDEKDLIDKTLKAKKAKKGLWQEIDSQGNYAHPKAIQFLSQSDIAASDKELEDKKDAMYKVARAGRKKFGDLSVFSGFIPNFAPPTSAIRIPWFKKFGNPAFDAIQPALGISKASDVDTFRQVNFRSAAEGADEKGDSNIFGPLYETFSRKALQLINKSNIFGEFVRGSALQPKAISSQTAFDEALLQKEGIVAFDFKGFPKKNLSSGSVAKHLNDKFNRVVKTDPEKAAKIKESIMAFNETGHESQLPSQFGKNFLELAGTSYSQMLKNSPGLVKALSTETDSLLNNYVKNPAFLAMAAASGFIPNFNGKKVNANFYRTKTGPGDIFPKEGTGLSGTNARKPGERLYGYMLEEAWNNMVMSILGNNVFIPDASSVNPRLVGDVNEAAQRSAKSAALNLSSAGRTTSLGLGRGMSENFGNSRYVPNPDAVYTGKVSGKMKKVNYDRLSKVLGVFWSSNPETKSAWDFLKNYAESGKFVDKKEIKSRTGLLRKSYEDWLIKNSYIGTQVKLSDYRKRGEGVGAVNYAALRSDLAGVSNLQNLGEMEKLKKYKEQGILYGDYKNNKAMYDKMGRWTYNAASKKMILNSASGFIPNFAYKQAVMGLEESMSGNKAIFDTKPFPHIRNSSQPTFSSAIADHGGLNNALNDSIRGQKAAGLMNSGYVPNFAVVKARESLGADFGSLSKAEQTLFLQLNIALTRLTKDTTLTSQQQQALQNTIQNNALMLQQSTKSIKIVNDANDALVLALQQNAQAQTTAAQTAAVPSGPKRAEQTLSTRIGGLLGGARGAVRGRRFDRMLGGLSNNVGFTLAAPMVGGILESAIAGGKDRSEMGYARRLASTGISGALTGLSTGASIGSAIPGIGTAAGAAIGAIVGFGGAVANARTTLDDLSKSIENVITRNKNDIELAKTIADLEKQLSVENDPLNIEILKMKIADSAEKIKDTKFSEKILQSSKSIDDFDKAIKEFTLEKKSIESLQKLPSAISAFSKETKTPESKYDISGLLSVQQSLFETKGFSAMFDKEEFQKINKRAQTLAPAYFKSFGNELLNLEKQVIEKAPNLSGNIKDIISNLNKYRKSGELENKLSPLVKAGVINEEYAASFVNILETVSNVFFDSYLNNIDTNLNNLKNTVQKEAKASAERVADMDTVKNVFATINNSIQNALTDYAIQLSNIDFAANVGKLNLEKTGNIFETAASAIGKNLQDIAKNQLDFLISQMDVMRQNNLLDIQATQFQQSREIQQKTFLTERKSRISAFLEPNIVNAPDSRRLAEQALSEIGENLNYDFKNLNSLSLKFSAEVQRSLNTLIEEEKRKQKTFSNDRANAATLFNLEQQYAKNLITLKDKTAKLDLELQQKTYANLLKEKQVIESFNFDAQALQIRTQAQIERMSIPMNVNPNFFAGATRFQQEDYKFRLDQEKERKQLAASLRSASNEAVLADFRSRILDSNTEAINNNVKATRDLTIALYRQKSEKLTEAQGDLTKEIQNLTSAPRTLEQTSPIERTNGFYNFDSGFRSYDYKLVEKEVLSDLNFTSSDLRKQYLANLAPLPRMVTDPLSIQNYNPSLFDNSPQLGQSNRFISEIKDVRNNNAIAISSQDKSVIYDPKSQEDFRFYKTAPSTTSEIDQSKIQALKQQAESTKKAKEETDSYLLSLEKLNEKRFAIQSEVTAATPYTSIIKSLEEEKMIFDQSLQTLTTRQAELNEQSKTKMTEAERVQLNDKLFNLTTEINKAKIQQLRVEESIKNAQEAQKNYMDYMASRGKFMTGVRKATAQMQEEISMFGETLGGTITTSFRDGLVGAMNAAANETDNLESALLNVASNFLKAIQNAMFTQIANQITTSLFPTGPIPAASQRGGVIRAQNGMYISGGRTGDKNPALLEDGEYVLNRKAVKAMGGPKALDMLNFRMAPRFASGGDPGSISAGVQLTEPFARLSEYGRENSPEFQAYANRLKEEQAERDRKKAEKDALVRQFLGTLISTGVSMGISMGFSALQESNLANANLKGATGATVNGQTTSVTSFADAKNLVNSGGSVTLANGSVLTKSNFAQGFTRSAFNDVAASRFAQSGMKVTPGGFLGRKPTYSYQQVGTRGPNYGIKTTSSFGNPYQAFGAKNTINPAYTPFDNPFYQSFGRNQTGGLMKFNSGGFLPYGNRLNDTIPALLTGGEYIVNSRAVRKYGVGGLNRINSGVAKFQDGGMVGEDSSSSPSSTTNTSNSNVSINITVNANNNGKKDESQDSSGDGTEGNAKELSNRIKAVVLEVISTEQRTGGLLDSTKKK